MNWHPGMWGGRYWDDRAEEGEGERVVRTYSSITKKIWLDDSNNSYCSNDERVRVIVVSRLSR